MKLSKIVIAAAVVATGASSVTTSAFAQAKEQFFPLLSYRTGPYAPNGVPWANGKQDYLKLINARDGGINGVRLGYEECETGYSTEKGVECYDKSKATALVTRHVGANPADSIGHFLVADPRRDGGGTGRIGGARVGVPRRRAAARDHRAQDHAQGHAAAAEDRRQLG